MKRVRDLRPDVLAFCGSAGGCAAALGGAFLLFGGALMLAPFVAAGERVAPAAWIVILLFSGAFVALGSVLVFGRYGLVVDRRAGRIEKWSGLVGMVLRRRIYRLADYAGLTLGREERGAREPRVTVFPVRLVPVGGGDAPEILTALRADSARRFAEAVCRFLNWPIEDTSSGRRLVRRPETLDLPLRERIRRGGGRLAPPPAMPPDLARCCRYDGRSLHLRRPPDGPDASTLLKMVCGLLVPAVVLSVVGSRVELLRSMPWPVLVFFASLILVFFLALPLLAFVVAPLEVSLMRTEVEATARRLRVVHRGLLGRREREVPMGELEDLVPVSEDPAHLLARSDRWTLLFGERLSPEALAWLHAAVRHIACR